MIFISFPGCMLNSGKKLVQVCHSVFGLKLKPVSACGLPNVGLVVAVPPLSGVSVFLIRARWRAAKYCMAGMPISCNNRSRKIFSRLLTSPNAFEEFLVRADCFTRAGLARMNTRSPSFTKTILPIAPLRLPFFFIFAIAFQRMWVIL